MAGQTFPPIRNAGIGLTVPYTCESLEGCRLCCCDPIKVPYDEHVLAPFVIARISDGRTEISVGNNSSPPRNHAVIKSFKYGCTVNSGGQNCEIEITDEAGSDFQRFFDKMARLPDPKEVNRRFWIGVRWGWIGVGCDNNAIVHSQTEHTFLLTKVDISFTHGLTSFSLKGTDISPLNFDMINLQSFGTNIQKRALKDVIAELAADNGCDVFYMKPGDQSTNAWEFVGGKGQPMGAWRAQGMNMLQVILNWVSPFKTSEGKGITFSFNSKRAVGSNNQLILWAEGSPTCRQRVDSCANSLGTYIVNGGNRSPVIDFRPSINWNYAGVSAGGAANTGGKDTVKEVPLCDIGQNPDPRAPATGKPTNSIANTNATEVYGPRDALKQAADATAAHLRVNQTYDPVKAELRVQGDPSLADPPFNKGKSVAIVVIQPFHLQDLGPQGTQWLQTDTCNRVLSNRNWMIDGTGDEIKGGSYTTTIKVILTVPGVNLNADQAFGGDEICGYRPPPPATPPPAA